MAILINIDGVDRTRKIEANSIRIDNILTARRDTCKFSILTNAGDTYIPNMGEEVVVYDGATKIFGGIITAMDSAAQAYAVIRHTIQCQDYTRLFDHRLVPDAFSDVTVDSIIATLKASYFPTGFTINNVDAPIMIKSVNFNYRPLSKCIDDLAKLINYDWYIDYDKDLHFFAKETMLAPFNLADDTGSYIFDSLVIRRDNSQIRNQIIVRGGEYLASQTTFEIQTNGVDFHFGLPYKFADFEATLTGTHLNLGIDNVDDADSYDALYNFQEKILRFKEADTPSANKTLFIAGKPYLPVIVKYNSPSAIDSMRSAESNPTLTSDGVYEYLIVDKSITSKEGARQRAQAEILAYATTLSEGEFITNTSGLKAGQAINVVSAARGLNETFIINKVSVTQFSKDTFIYSVSLITTRTADLIEILQRLLLQSTKDIVIDPNEVSDIVFNFDDTVAFTDTLGTFSTHGGSYNWGVDGSQGNWNFSTWS